MSRIGWYLNSKFYNNKWSCISENNYSKKNITFYFFDDIFANLNWEVEPVLSYEYLLEQRARQLRDSYDYLRLWYTSGSDSETILQTFLKHNIYIDEIAVAKNPFINSDRELNKRAIPRLKLLENKFPNTFINIFQTSTQQYLEILENQDYDKIASDITLRSMSYLSSCYYTHPKLLEAPHFKYNKVANLIGHIKPKLEKRNNKFFTYEWDTAISTVTLAPNLEMFYTSPNFPELHLKQCHIAKNYIKHKYPQINHQVFSENNEYREDIETAIRVPIDNTHTFTKENTLRNLTPKAKLALQEAYTTAPNVYYAFKNLTKDYAFMFKKWNTLGIKSKEYCLGT